MTKGQEIVCMYCPVTDSELVAMIDAAIAVAVSRRTVECDRVASEWMREHGTMDVWTGLHLAIIALNAPPAPAYPFGCKCWTRLGEGGAWHRVTTGGYTCGFQLDAKHCEICGAPRTKGA